jgi:hypothetical protein
VIRRSHEFDRITPITIPVQQDRTLGSFPDAQVDRPSRSRRQRDGDDPAALAGDYKGAWSELLDHEGIILVWPEVAIERIKAAATGD